MTKPRTLTENQLLSWWSKYKWSLWTTNFWGRFPSTRPKKAQASAKPGSQSGPKLSIRLGFTRLFLSFKSARMDESFRYRCWNVLNRFYISRFKDTKWYPFFVKNNKKHKPITKMNKNRSRWLEINSRIDNNM